MRASLNHVYRLVWDKVHKSWIAVAETSRGQSKSGRSSTAGGVALLSTGVLSLGLMTSAWALPTGGQVSAGNGQIVQSINQTTINQQSQNLAINWQTFNIGNGEQVTFNQPNSSAIALNRVLGQNPSQILGQLQANGQVFLLNPNGVLFGSGAQVSVGGLVASTLGLSDADLLKGNFKLSGNSTASVINNGNINTSSGGYVALLGATVSNNGTITTPQGNVSLAAGQQVTLQLGNGSLLGLTVDQSAVDALSQNHGLIQAHGGQVLLTADAADAVTKAVVNNDGIIDASGVSTDGGKVLLIANGGNTINSGAINATGVHGGTVQLLSDQNVGVTGGSIDASGALGGGSIRVGGGWQGGEGLQTAEATYVAPDALLKADATQSGNGGSVVVWGNEVNNFYGDISARGGALSGNGGRVETSSHNGLNVQGQVDASAPHGTAGTWLLDPYDVTISNGLDSNVNNTGSVYTASGNPSVINAGELGNALTGGTNVFVFTNTQGNGAHNGDITVNNPIAASGAGSLYLEAAGSIFLNAGIASNGSNPLNVNLWSNYGGAAAGTTYSSNASCGSSTGCVVALNSGLNISGNLNIASGVSGIQINGSVNTGGSQTYNNAVTLLSNSTLTSNGTGSNGAINFASTVNGAYALNVGTAGLITFGGNVGGTTALASLTMTGNSLLGGNVTTSGSQIYVNPVTLGNSVTLTSSTGNVTFDDKVDNAISSAPKALTINAQNGAVTFVNPVGSVNAALAGLTIDSLTFSSGGATNSTFLNIGNLGLSITTSDGDINQGGAFVVAGPSNFNASNGASTINLNNANNILTGAVTATGNGIGITAASSLNIAALHDASNGEVRLISGGSLNLAPATINTGSAELILEANGGALTTTANLTGAIIFLSGATGLNINNTLNATNGLTLESSGGAITESANGLINTPSMSISSAGDTTLNNPANNIGSLGSASAANFSLVDSASLTVGNVVSKTTTIHSNNDLTLNGVINASGTGDAIVLATGPLSGFTNNAGSNALNASNGNWLVWSWLPSGGVLRDYSLSEDFVQYNANYGSTAVQGSGNGLLYTYAPTIHDVLEGSISKTYDGTTTATLSSSNYVVVGESVGDTVTTTTPSTGTYASADANTTLVPTTTVSVNGLSIVSATRVNNSGTTIPAYGYQINPLAIADIGKILPATVTISGLMGTDKVYDGKTTDQLTGTAVINGLVAGQNLNFTGGTIGTLASANAGSEPVTVAITLTNGTGLGAGNASNYTLAGNPVLPNVTVSPAPITVTGISGTNQTYNGGSLDLLTGTGVLHGLVGSETLVLNNTTTGTLSSPNAGSQSVTTNLTLSNGTNGGIDGNYYITQPILPNVIISPAQLIVTGLAGTNQVYNGTNIDALTGTATLFGLVNGETLTLGNTTTGTLSSPNAGSEGVTSAVTLGNGTGLASNYALTQAILPNVTISPAPLTISGLLGTNRTYNGTTLDALTGTAFLSGLVNGETLTLGNTSTGVLSSANAGSEGVTTAVTLANGTGLASNYSLTQAVLPNVNINPALLTVTGLSGTDRVYNGTTLDLLSGTGILQGLVNGETLVLNNTATGTLASANVGLQAISTNLNLSNGTGLASNYTLTQPTLTATITPAQLIVTGLSGTDRVYDGTTVDVLRGNPTLFGLVNGETLTLNNTTTGTLASANAGSEGVSTAITLGNGTGLASNYNLIQAILPNVVISPAALTITAQNAQKNEGSPNPILTVNTSGLVGNDTLASLNGNLSITTSATQTSPVGKYSIVPSGLSSGNYTIQYVNGVLAIVSSNQSPGYVGSLASVLLPYPDNGSKTPPTAIDGENLLSVVGTGISLPYAARDF